MVSDVRLEPVEHVPELLNFLGRQANTQPLVEADRCTAHSVEGTLA